MGTSFISLHYEYLLGATAVRDTCDAMWQCLAPAYMSARHKNDCWIRTADEHYERTNFPELHRSC